MTARNDVLQLSKFSAEEAFALQHPRDAAIQAIEDASKDNGRHRLVPLPRNGESYAGQSEAKRHCRHGIWRHLSQTDAAPRAARETVFRHIHWETPVRGVGSPNFARNVSPATERCPRTTRGDVPLARY